MDRLGDPRLDPGQRRERGHSQGIQHVFERLARIAMVSLRRRLSPGGRLYAAAERAYSHRRRLFTLLTPQAPLDRPIGAPLLPDALRVADYLLFPPPPGPVLPQRRPLDQC